MAAQEEEEDTEEEEEEEEEERAFREERTRVLRGEAPTMTLQEFSDLENRVFARASARAAQPALSRFEELGDEIRIRVEGTRLGALEFKAKEAFLSRSGLSGQALVGGRGDAVDAAEGGGEPAPQDACHGHAPRGEEGGQACRGGGAQGDCA